MDGDITTALSEWAAGDQEALHRLAPAVYPQLRELARGLLFRERAGHTLQATALVNELFLKLIAQREPRFESRLHFYNACAKLMRLALIDHARGVGREKRGSRYSMVSMEAEAIPLHPELRWVNAVGPEMMDLDRLLNELALLDAEQAAMFEARYFLGCTAEETAELFKTSKASVDRKVRLARAWLFQQLRGGEQDSISAAEEIGNR